MKQGLPDSNRLLLVEFLMPELWTEREREREKEKEKEKEKEHKKKKIPIKDRRTKTEENKHVESTTVSRRTLDCGDPPRNQCLCRDRAKPYM